MSADEIVKIMESLPLFEAFTKSDCEKLAKMAMLRPFSKNEVVFKEGQTEGSLYIIVSGSIKITKSAETGEEILLAELDKGDFFGEMELLVPSKAGRTASAVAEENSTLLEISKKDIENALKDTELSAYRLIHFFAKVLCDRLRRMDDAYTKLFLEYKGRNKINELKRFREKLIKEWGF